MLTFLIIVLFVVVTFLITDFRRHLQIENLTATHKAEMFSMDEAAYEIGYKDGANYVHGLYEKLDNSTTK